MKDQIVERANQMTKDLVAWRRDLHTYPEVAWTEFRTTSFILEQLTDFGYEVMFGDEIIMASEMMGVPPAEVLEAHMERAKSEGASPQYLDKMQGGKTGVVAILETNKPGPVIALRFDIDSNDVNEVTDATHRPFLEGFASTHSGAMHACGHDGHTAIGLGVAKLLMEMRDKLCGTIKLIFQPGEEGVRGARSMVATGIVDDVDYLCGLHIGFRADQNELFYCGGAGFLATSKFDAVFTGVPSHAGAFPEQGKNALLAAATATLNLHAISRHSAGTSRINVGVFQAGTGRNVLPANAIIQIETRGATTEIDAYMKKEAIRVIESAANMYDVKVDIAAMGSAVAGTSDSLLIDIVRDVAEELGAFSDIHLHGDLGGSEDFTYFMNRVQEHGGKAIYSMIGSKIAAGHHDSHFDFDESVLPKAVAQVTLQTLRISMIKK